MTIKGTGWLMSQLRIQQNHFWSLSPSTEQKDVRTVPLPSNGTAEVFRQDRASFNMFSSALEVLTSFAHEGIRDTSPGNLQVTAMNFKKGSVRPCLSTPLHNCSNSPAQTISNRTPRLRYSLSRALFVSLSSFCHLVVSQSAVQTSGAPARHIEVRLHGSCHESDPPRSIRYVSCAF